MVLKVTYMITIDRKPRGYWQDVKNVRAFLDEYAKKESFDALDSGAWKEKGSPLTRKKFISLAGGLRRVLERAYPEMK